MAGKRYKGSRAKNEGESMQFNFEKEYLERGQSSSSSAKMSAQSLARENVESDITINGEHATERDLTADLIKRMRQEQGRTVRETEEAILKDRERSRRQSQTSQSSNNERFYQRPVAGATATTMQGGSNSSSSFNVGMQNNNVNLNGSFNAGGKNKGGSGNSSASDSSQSGNSRNSSNRGGDAGAGSLGGIANDDDNSDEELQDSEGRPIFDRDKIKSDLENASKAKKIDPKTGQVFDKNGKPIGNINNNSSNRRNSSAGFGAAAAGMGAGMAGAEDTSNIGRERTTRARTGNGTAGRPQSVNGERTADEELTDQITSAARKTANFARNTTRQVSSMAKTGAKVLGKAKMLLIAKLAIIILVLIALVGAISFFMNMPGMVRDKIVNTFETIWQEAVGLLVGQDQPTSTQVAELANYL